MCVCVCVSWYGWWVCALPDFHSTKSRTIIQEFVRHKNLTKIFPLHNNHTPPKYTSIWSKKHALLVQNRFLSYSTRNIIRTHWNFPSFLSHFHPFSHFFLLHHSSQHYQIRSWPLLWSEPNTNSSNSNSIEWTSYFAEKLHLLKLHYFTLSIEFDFIFFTHTNVHN